MSPTDREGASIENVCSRCGLPRSKCACPDRRASADRANPLKVLSDETPVSTVTIGSYKLISLLGQGGMGSVYKAEHEILHRAAAVKILRHDDVPVEAGSVIRFEQEAIAASKLSHPNLVTLFDFGRTPSGAPYLVMEYLEGESLAERIGNGSKLQMDEAIDIGLQICDGVSYMHAQGVLHRDLKPSNVILVKNENGNQVAKIVDFGLAKFMQNADTAAANLTRSGELFGSPPYMSPEQCQCKKLDERSDIYSLGCIMYEMCTGQTPLMGDAPLLTIMKQVNEKPRSPLALNPDLPRGLDAVIMRTLEKDLSLRYQSVETLKRDLTQIRKGQDPAISTKLVKATSGFVKWHLPLATTATVIAMVGYSFSIIAPQPSRPWQDFVSQAERYIQKADSRMAIVAYQKALAKARQVDAPVSEKAAIELPLADLYKRSNQGNDTASLERAIYYYKSAIQGLHKDDNEGLARANEGIADCLFRFKKFKEAEPYYQRAASIYAGSKQGQGYALAAALMKQGRNFKDAGSIDKAKPILLRAAQILRKLEFIEQAYFPDCLKCLREIAEHENQWAAAKLYQEAADAHKRINGPDDPKMRNLIERRNRLIDEAQAMRAAEP